MISNNTVLKQTIRISLLLICLFLSLQVKSTEKDSLLIRFNSWDKHPVHLSTCSNFEVMNGYKDEYIIPSESVDTLKLLLNNLETAEDIYFPVGCKLYFFHNDTISLKVCMNRKYIAQNGLVYFNNDTIVEFINHLMGSFLPNVKSDNRFLPDIMGANYEGGMRKLYRTLNEELYKLSAIINYSGTMIMKISCEANKEGRTTQAEVKIVNPMQPSRKEYALAHRLRKFIKKHIVWVKDCDRGPYDHILFSVRFKKTE